MEGGVEVDPSRDEDRVHPGGDVGRPNCDAIFMAGGVYRKTAMAARTKVFRIVLEPAEDIPTEWYVATSPDLPGLVTQGKGMDETVRNVKEAVSLCFDGNPPAYRLDVRVAVAV